MDFYTNAFKEKDKIYIRGFKNGKRYSHVIKYKPYLFIPTTSETEKTYKNIYGSPLAKIDFANIWDARQFIKDYENVAGMEVHGLTDFEYVYLNDNYEKELTFDKDLINIVGIDIEVLIGKETIAQSLVNTPNPITAITMSHRGKKYSFGYKDYRPHLDNVIYHRCDDETHMLREFSRVWQKLNPDVVTGWNTNGYDRPYLFGRILRILGEDKLKELSPWGMIKKKKIEIKDTEISTYDILGVASLDYMEVYKKFILTKRDSYSLNFIGKFECGIEKVDYGEYKGLNDLYERNYQLYMEYNIHDTEIVDRIDAKLKLLDQAFTVAYFAKINYEDTLTSVKMWDCLIHNDLMSLNVAVDPKKITTSGIDYDGGYVKEPTAGMYEWPSGIDLTSMYPKLIEMYNISPETYIKQINVPSIDEIVNGAVVNHGEYSVAANGACFRKDFEGFLPRLMRFFFDKRATVKVEMKSHERDYELSKNDELQELINRLDNLQNALKVILNSAYGVLANQYFRYFRLVLAEAITMSGQLTIKYTEKSNNKYINTIMDTENKDYVIYLDTDSCYINMGPIIDKFYTGADDNSKKDEFVRKIISKRILPNLNNDYEKLKITMNAYSQKMNMKIEKVSSRGVWTGKKRYILDTYSNEGVIYSEPKISLVGVGAKSSTIPELCREALKKSYDIILRKDEKTIQNFVEEFRTTFNKQSVDKISKNVGVSDMMKYRLGDKAIPIHNRGALVHNKFIKDKGLSTQPIASGDKVKLCYMKMPNPLNSNVICFNEEMPPEFNLDEYIDYKTQFEKAFIKPLKSILDAINWRDEKVMTIDDWFN